jgi:hypothetical protein
MSQWWLVNKETKELLESADDAKKASYSIDESLQWLAVPEGVAVGNAKVQTVEGVDSLVDGSADKAGPKWSLLRQERDLRLADCDWTQLSDSPLSVEAKALWVTYRQSLRDLPANTSNPDSPSWPSQPA